MTPASLSQTSAIAAPAPPDINAETYPFDVVLENLDRTAFFHFYCGGAASMGPGCECGEAATGFHLRHLLHRFSTPSAAPPSCDGFKADNFVGEPMASLEHWWRFMPDRFAARPGVAVPEIPFDPGRSQRFAMTGGFCSFSSASAPVSAPAHGFHGFGAGMTYPVPGGDRDVLLAGAVGTLTSGFGRFRGLDGTYTCIGTLSREAGFRGSIMLRVCDPMGRLAGGEHPGPMRRGYALEPGVTYIVFRGQKKSAAEKTGFLFGPGGDIAGLRVHQELRLISIDSACNAEGRPRSSWNVGPVIGEMDARIKFNLTNPGAPGTNDAPIPFQSANSFRFFDGRGGAIGTLDSDGGEGRTFRLQLPESPRQNALRFGAFLPLTRGSGCFEGVRGIMTDNSVVGIAPHAISTLYVLRLDDPHGRFRLRLRDAWQ